MRDKCGLLGSWKLGVGSCAGSADRADAEIAESDRAGARSLQRDGSWRRELVVVRVDDHLAVDLRHEMRAVRNDLEGVPLGGGLEPCRGRDLHHAAGGMRLVPVL